MNEGKKLNNTYCCVPQCNSRACKEPNLSFHRFPGETNSRNAKRRKEWIRVLRTGKKISNRMVVCSKHFQKQDYILPDLPTKRPHLKNTAVPSLCLPVLSTETETKLLAKKTVVKKSNDRYDSITRKREANPKEDTTINEQEIIAVNVLLSLCPDKHGGSSRENDAGEPIFPEQENIDPVLEQENIDPVPEQENIDPNDAIQDLYIKTQGVVTLDKCIQVCSGDLQSRVLINVKNLNMKQLRCLTGISSRLLIEKFVICLTNELKNKPKRHLSVRERLILTLMKMKLNVSFVFLAVLFGCSSTTCSTIFSETVVVLAGILKGSIRFSSKDEVLSNMPRCFKHFSDVRMVLDCTEIAVEKPQCLTCYISTYSHYKGTNTIKYMVCITPGEIISFVSLGYGGRASDKEIFEQSRVIEMLEPCVDAVMVDKGYQIDSICSQHMIKLVQPPFLKGKKVFPKHEAIATKKIAKARVHVERVIQRLKIFKIFSSGKLSWKLVGIADSMLTVAAGITNLSFSVLAEDKYLK